MLKKILPKNLGYWITSYLQQKILRIAQKKPKGQVHVMFCFADHHEPRHGGVDKKREFQRIAYWKENYPLLANQYLDSDGFHPRHSFFFPEEEYREEHIESIASLCERGFGEVEVHLHHDDDTADGFKEKITSFCKILHQEHGFLGKDSQDNVRYSFIHGNWALNNSRPDGRWCGVDNETDILLETGCYADLTMPSAPSDTQTKKINSIYYASPFNGCPKSHDTGENVYVGGASNGRLLMVQGPLTLNWGRTSKGMPKIEYSDVSETYHPARDRVALWLDVDIHVKGRPEWVFIKVHTHGSAEECASMLLGKGGHTLHSNLQALLNDGQKHKLHYVTAREMVNIIKAAEAGESGDPNHYRDYKIKPPVRLTK